MVQHQRHDQKIAVFQQVGCSDHLGRRGWAEGMDQIAQRHGVDEMHPFGAFHRAFGAIRVPLLHIDRGHMVAIAVHRHHFGPHLDLATLVGHDIAHPFPHHAGTKAGIFEFLNQAGGVVRPGNGVPHRLDQRQVLDALRRPVGADFLGRDTPDLFGVAAEEMHVEPPAKAVDHPFFK